MIRVVQMGLGPLGQKVAKFAAERQNLRIVAAVDPAPDKCGRKVSELTGVGDSNLTISADLTSALAGAQADVAILTTVSDITILESQIREAAEAGLHIVSTCEELSFSWDTQPELSKRIDAVCKANGVACLGTGVNPGFLMDYLPSVLTSVCQKVDKVLVERIQDASPRRIPFQKKIGAGLTVERFKAKAAEKTLRHVGLTESMQMIAKALNWKLDRVEEDLEPVLAEQQITSGYMPIEPGFARGVQQIGRAYIADREVIRLHFRAAVGEPESYDRVTISGQPDIVSTIEGGVNGDIATCAITLNSVPAVTKCQPGLKTMLDVPVPSCCG